MELKQPRRRRRQLQLIKKKTIRFMSKTTALQVHHSRFLVHFFDCSTTTSNLLMRRFMEDMNIWRRIFLSTLNNNARKPYNLGG